MPTSDYWEYTYQNPQIVVVYENYTELLTFSDIRVTITDGNQMKATVGYEIHTDDDVDYAEYTVTDNFNVSQYSLFVKSTQEVLNRWDEPPSGDHTGSGTWVHANTTYSQPLLIMSDTVTPTVEENNTYCTASISYQLYDKIFIRSYKIIMPVTTICTIGDAEPVTVNGKSYETIPVTIQQNETVKRWWLAQNTGIVRMEHPLNDATLRADLTEMAIDISAPEKTHPSTASKRSAPVNHPAVPTIRASAPGLEGHLELLRALIQ